MPLKRHQETPQLSRRCFSGAGASTAGAQPAKRCKQEQKSSWSGKLELNHKRMRRVLRVTTAPIFKSRKRMVPT
jgi:hypothetical protein